MKDTVGADALRIKGRFGANRWLVARRVVQVGILALFLAGPLVGLWIVKGNLTSSLTLNVLPLTDPYVLLQSWLTGHMPQKQALIGALIVVVFYLLVGGRVFCSWVCPVNMVTDLAAWLRRRIGVRASAHLARHLRYWMLAMTLVLSALTGTIAWELVNPVSMLHRGLIFGVGFSWAIVAVVFLFDLFVAKNGWCAHVCPVGAFYSLLGRFAWVRVAAVRRTQCNDCGDCLAVCPEPQVIPPALKGEAKGLGPVILAANCTNCGRCIDVCSKDVFEFGGRLNGAAPKVFSLAKSKEVS